MNYFYILFLTDISTYYSVTDISTYYSVTDISTYYSLTDISRYYLSQTFLHTILSLTFLHTILSLTFVHTILPQNSSTYVVMSRNSLYVRAKFLSVGIASSNSQIIILKIWDLILIGIWYQQRWTTMFLNATSFKQLKISENKIEEPISMPFLRTSQGPTPQTLLLKMQNNKSTY